MTQAQLGISFTMANDEGKITDINWHPREEKIVCTLSNNVSLTLNRSDHKTVLSICKGRKVMDLSLDQYESLCDFKLGFQLLLSFLEGNAREHQDKKQVE
jgi:hypothetical protein